MVTEPQQLSKRIEQLEQLSNQELLTIVEIMSNFNFFGELKRANCEYAQNGQCSYFLLHSEVKNKIPILEECRIEECEEMLEHKHIELSNITCSLCQRTIADSSIPLELLNHKEYSKTIEIREE